MPRPVPPSPPKLDADAGVRALLAQQKWRQARDELKKLVKVDRARYLPLLVDANVGLARKMLDAGQVSDARQVLENLKAIAPPERLRELELEIALKAGGPGGTENALAKLIAALADSTAPLADAERNKVADAAVLSFQPGAVPDSSPPTGEARVREELHAVQAALEALSRSAWTEVADALRRVPFRSPFGHWAVFIKGVAAFHVGEDDRAVKLWRSLPPESVPAKTSRSYLLLVADATADGAYAAASRSVMDGACRLVAGSSADLVMRADRQWREGHIVASYQAVRDKQADFPSVALGWRGSLTEFYFKTPHAMVSDDWRRYLSFFLRQDEANAFKDEIEAMLAHRLAALLGRRLAPVEELRRHWKEFLRIHQSVHGANPVLASLGHGWLGEQLSQPANAHEDEWEAEDFPDAKYAIEELETSIRLDPTNLKAQLHLCKLYEILKKTSERNHLLDRMTKRFPDDKDVLVATARGCLERNVFKKAMDYLERAWQLDRLDPQIPRLIVAALEGQARTYFQQRRPDDARQALARTGEWLTERPDDLQISRWSVSARHAAIERIWGDPDQAENLLGESRRLSPLAVAPLLIAHLAHRVHLKPHRADSPFLPTLEETLALHATPREIGPLLRILESWVAANEKFRAGRERTLIVDALKNAAGQSFTRAEALALIEQTGSHVEYRQAIGLFVKKILRADPKDPAFRLWKIKSDADLSMDIYALRDEVEAIVAEATQRRDESTLRGARALLRTLKAPPPTPDFDDDTDFDDDADFDDDHDYEEEGFPPEFEGFMKEFMAMIKKATPAEVRILRKHPPPGVPRGLLDTLIEMAQAGIPLPPLGPGPRKPNPPKSANPAPLRPPSPPPPAPKSAKPTPRPSDPDQLNLF